MKIWVDDVREPPDASWAWFKDSESLLDFIDTCRIMSNRGVTWWNVEKMSLDHDLGGDDTTRPVVLWMCENEFWPEEVVVHSANPVGVEWLEGMIERYKR